MELKSLKEYVNAYRDIGIFYENAVNRILQDIVKACKPKWAIVRGDFNTRGGMKSVIEARYRVTTEDTVKKKKSATDEHR